MMRRLLCVTNIDQSLNGLGLRGNVLLQQIRQMLLLVLVMLRLVLRARIK